MAIIFDLDGVLLDTLDLHRSVWHEWASVHGLDGAAVFEATFGRRPADTIADVAPTLDLVAELGRLEDLLDANADAVALQPGARSAIDVAGEDNWGVVTSTGQRRARHYLAHLGCPVPSVVVGGDDVERGKPAPDGYLTAARRLGVAPANCLVVEDAPAGVEAAKRAGAMVLAVATTRPREQLARADLVVDDLTAAVDLLQNWLDESRRRRT